jgi:hypothetical protein
MARRSFLSRRLFLLASGGLASAILLNACVSDPAFVHEPLASPSPPPAKMQRLLLWLPASDARLDGANVAARFTSALAPYGVTMETGRSTRLEVDRSADQKAVIEKFRPTYRLEIDIPEGRSETSTLENRSGSTSGVSATSFVVRGVLYRGDSRTPLARYHFHAQSRYATRFVEQVVEKLKDGGYL